MISFPRIIHSSPQILHQVPASPSVTMSCHTTWGRHQLPIQNNAKYGTSSRTFIRIQVPSSLLCFSNFVSEKTKVVFVAFCCQQDRSALLVSRELLKASFPRDSPSTLFRREAVHNDIIASVVFVLCPEQEQKWQFSHKIDNLYVNVI